MVTAEQLTACGLETAEATDIAAAVNRIAARCTPTAAWNEISRSVLTPHHPFALHQFLYTQTYADGNRARYGPPPAWFPTDADIAEANITYLMRSLNLSTYPELHAWSVTHRDRFWQRMIETLGIQARQTTPEVQRGATGIATHLVSLNIVESCFNAPPDAIAVVAQRENEEAVTTLTYAELALLTNRVANGLMEIGLKPGDAVAVAMPMTLDSVAIYLGIIKAGCVVIGIADSFAPDEIATRLRIGAAQAIFTQGCMTRAGKRLPLYQKVVAADGPKAIVLRADAADAPRLRPHDMRWADFLSAEVRFTAHACHPDAPTNILFSSGTTGTPKAIPWTHTTPIKCAADAFLHHDIHPSDVLAWPTNLGWMMGPWLIYASLINRATIALYDGVPTGRDFGVFVQNTGVTLLGVVPTLVRAWKRTGCMHGLDWGRIRAFSSTGECSNPEEMLYLMYLAGYKPVIEYCGGTEIGGGYITGTRVQPASPSTFTTPALGLDVVILDDDGTPADTGEAFIVPPSFGLSATLLNADHNAVYFSGTPRPGLRRHGDAMQRFGPAESGSVANYRVHGRVDDTMNLSGIKVSAAAIEEVLNRVEGIQETAAVAIAPEAGGACSLVIYVVLATAAPEPPEAELHAALQTEISERLNPLFRIHDLVIVETLPRTASNKVMRRLLREAARRRGFQTRSS